MGSEADITSSIKAVLGATWNQRDGTVVPTTEDVALSNGAVKLDAVFLYADLAHSTKLARTFDRRVAAKVVRAFLSTATRLIHDAGGHVRSFDGDRVMGVFVGKTKNTDAARCALKINYAVTKLLRPLAEAKYPLFKEKGFVIAHCCGLHASEVLVVRGGVRGHNDLVFVGSAPNLAAKLSEVRNGPWNTYLTHTVYGRLLDSSKLGGEENQNMWIRVERTLDGQKWTCYKSSWTWKP